MPSSPAKMDVRSLPMLIHFSSSKKVSNWIFFKMLLFLLRSMLLFTFRPLCRLVILTTIMIMLLPMVMTVTGRVVFHGATMASAILKAPNPIALYQFTNDACLTNAVFPNQVKEATMATATSSVVENNLPQVIRNEVTTVCSRGLGVQPTTDAFQNMTTASSNNISWMVTTDADNEKLLHQLQERNKGVSFELWIKPMRNIMKDDAIIFPIFVIGSNLTYLANPDPVYDDTLLCDNEFLDLHLGQRNNILELTFRNSDSTFVPCQRFPLIEFPLKQGQITHVVITLSTNGQQVFINGQGSAILKDPFSNSFPSWSSQYTMHFFSHSLKQRHGVPLIWQGQLYQFAIFDDVLTEQQVQHRMTGGLPPSNPFAVESSVTVNEVSDLDFGSHNTSWHNADLPQHLDPGNIQSIPLGIGSIDLEVVNLLHSHQHHYDMIPPLPNIDFYITRLPSRGLLFQLLGSDFVALTPKPHRTGNFKPILIHQAVTGNASVVYLPVPNEHSDPQNQVYTTFEYCIVTAPKIVLNSHQCDSGTISIMVRSVNDPPLPVLVVFPHPVFESATTEAIRLNTYDRPMLQLTGIDIDRNASITNIRIMKPPRWGHLVLSVPKFRPDGLLDGINLKVVNYTFAAPGFVEYVYDGGSKDKHAVVFEADEVLDTFQFQVADEHGLWSVPKSVSVHVVSAVEVIPGPEIITTLEDTRCSITLRGNDTSGWRRPLGFFVESAPPPEMGVLIDPVTGRTLRGGTVLSAQESFPYHNGSTILFSPQTQSACSNPVLAQQAFIFTFRAIVFRPNDERLASVSAPFTQNIRIQCIIHRLELNGLSDNTTFQIQTSTHGDILDDDPCSGYFYNASKTPPSNCSVSAAIAQGITVSTQDFVDIQKAWVVVFSDTTNGRITLNRNFWSLLDLKNGREEVASRITFSAYPRHLTSILSFLHYQSDTSENDSLRIFIAYGYNCKLHLESDINALATSEANTSSFPDCQMLKNSIPITVVEATHSPRKYLIQGFPWYIILILLGFAALIKFKAEMKSFLCRWRLDKVTVVEQQEHQYVPKRDSSSGKAYYEDQGDMHLSGLIRPREGCRHTVMKRADLTARVI